MAKHLVQKYTFVPSENTVFIDGNVPHKRLLLITNITDNVILYNFADDQLKVVSISYDDYTEKTTIVLAKNCNSMSATDTLQIFYEQDHVYMEPSETFVDPVSKFRVSTPENLVDTDFEYGPQASKWETLQLINQIPSFFSSTSDTTISFITGVQSTTNSEIILVTTEFDHNLTSGIPITVTGLESVTAEGTYLIQSVPTSKTFTYKARAKQLETKDLEGTYTSIIPGQFFQGSQISVDEASGITSDYITKKVTIKSVEDLTLDSNVTFSWEVGELVSSDNGASGVLTKINGNIISLTDIEGIFAANDTVSIVGSPSQYLVSSVGVSDGKFFIDGVQQPILNLNKKSIYIFDISDPSNTGHLFAFSTTSDGTYNGGTEYTDFVYQKGVAGTSGSYIRIYVTNNTPQLHYWCASGIEGGHIEMGNSAPVVVISESKVILRTVSEHGFSDNTNFYFVNSVSPKSLDVQDTSATAPDGRPFADVVDQLTFVATPVVSETIPYNYESTYTLRFGESDINYGLDTITIPAHGLQNGYALLYYPAPGDTPINGLNRMCVYYAERIDANTIKLHDSQRTNILKNLQAGGTFNFGKHNLGLCYNTYREYKAWGDFYLYYYTYYWNWGGTYSGHDFTSNTAPYNTTFGLGNQAWDIVATFSIARPGYSGHNFYVNNSQWHGRFGTNWKTYGYHLTTLPLGTTAQYQGGYDFITDHENFGVNGDNNGNYQYGYTLGGYNRINGKLYWTATFFGDYMQAQYLRIYGNDSYYWAYQGDNNGWWASRNGYTTTNDRYFNGITSDGSTNMYFMLCKRNTSTNDSFFALDHKFLNNYNLTLTVNSGNGILYWNNTTNGSARLTTGAVVFAEKIDDNRFRIKPTTSSAPYRLAAADGNYTFSTVQVNPTKNSIYIANNQFSNGELILLTVDGAATAVGGLTNNQTYYFKAINADRFQLGTTPTFTTEIDLTTSGSGLHTFENASASFGAIDGSYTTTRAIDDFTLEITLPFKISPGNKPFDSRAEATGDVTTGANGFITITDHYFATGTRVIYDTAGAAEIGGLEDNYDYYVIVLDDSRIRLAATLEDALAGTAITLTTASTGTHRLITANLSGLITGAGNLATTNDSRIIKGTGTTFKRFFKIGDIIRIIDTGTTPGTIYARRVTAIKDDNELLVDTTLPFTNSSAKYFIPTFIYVRPDGYFLHRPFDGGMEIGTSKSPDGLICRQTRKYFRYQSGKGIQTSFAINFIPQNAIVSLAYTPQGTPGTYLLSGTTGEFMVTVAGGTSELSANMEIEGVGIDVGCSVLSIIDETTIELSKPLTSTITDAEIVFEEAQYSTIRAQRPHNVSVGSIVTITGSNVENYNDDFTVSEIVNDFEFRILVKDLPENNSASGGFPQFGVKNWINSAVRAGMFDFQNGFFFEYDGEHLNCVRRSSVQQLTGLLAVELGSSVVFGENTQFTSQLQQKDKIVIRGMSYKVAKIRNNNELVIQPAYKGVTNDNVIGTKTIDVRTPQHEWNIDKCDGDGPSGFVLHIDRIQMAYMDYSWYGAGKIRYGFKDQNGHVKYVHEYKHNNKLTESYFRSGNLPGRYEIENIGTPTFVPSLFHWGTSVIMDGMFQDDEAYLFTATGNVLKFTNASTQTATSNLASVILEERVSSFNSRYYIRIRYASTEASKLTVNTLVFQNNVANGYFANGRLIDSRSFVSGSSYFVYVQYISGSQTVFPRNYASTINAQLGGAIPSGTVFNVGSPAGSENLIPPYVPLISIRLAPSVDSSITGALGEREIINRMQLQLDSIGVQVTHDTEITMILNPELSTDLYQDVPPPSLCQLVRHSANETISGGQRILSFRASGGSVEGSRRLAASTNFNLEEISSLGNSILGGDGVYPNGPDLLTIIAEIVDSTGVSATSPYSATARVTWKESQA